MTIDESQQDIIDQFADIDDWMDKYAYIIDMGSSLPALPEQLKTPTASSKAARAACGSTPSAMQTAT